MINIGSVCKRYGKLVALDNVSFEVNDNECFALLGLNGAGKTTLINILSTSLLPTAGTVTVNGLDIIKDCESVRKIVNISPQESAVAKNLTVRENLYFMASLYGIENKNEKIDGIIEKFGLREKENVKCKKLSGGQLRRVRDFYKSAPVRAFGAYRKRASNRGRGLHISAYIIFARLYSRYNRGGRNYRKNP
ncbi:MAG: ABC transporter ATP-binding protein [Clostridiales bacterium]|nr:ABC transporter ATP-binding protein [Clostridiales bacterium]